MKLTKEALKRIIKEELDAVLELRSVDGKPTTRDQRKAGYGKNQVSKPMALDAAIAQLGMDKEKSWAVLSEPENVYIKEKIEALAQRLYDNSKAKGSDAFKKAKKGEYDKLIAAIEAAGGTFTPTMPDENSKGEQEDG